MKIYSDYLKKEYDVKDCEIQDITGNKITVTKHEELERIFFKDAYPVFSPKYCYKTVLNDGLHVVIECHIFDSTREVIGIGETLEKTLNNDIAAGYPVLMAYKRAFDDTVTKYLGIYEKIYTSAQILPPSQNQAVPQKIVPNTAPNATPNAVPNPVTNTTSSGTAKVVGQPVANANNTANTSNARVQTAVPQPQPQAVTQKTTANVTATNTQNAQRVQPAQNNYRTYKKQARVNFAPSAYDPNKDYGEEMIMFGTKGAGPIKLKDLWAEKASESGSSGAKSYLISLISYIKQDKYLKDKETFAYYLRQRDEKEKKGA